MQGQRLLDCLSDIEATLEAGVRLTAYPPNPEGQLVMQSAIRTVPASRWPFLDKLKAAQSYLSARSTTQYAVQYRPGQVATRSTLQEESGSPWFQ